MPRKTKQDPTGQAINRKRSAKRLAQRLRRAEVSVKALMGNVPRTRRSQVAIVNAETVVYDYDLTPEQQAALQAEIRTVLDTELETSGDRVPPDWFWKKEVELPYRQGTLEELNLFNQLVAGAVIAGVLVRGMEPQRVPTEMVLTSRVYREALNKVYVSNYTSIKTLSQRTADQVIQRLNAGIESGLSPTEISKDIAERFDVSRASANRIADTEINKAYNDAKLEAVKTAEQQTGLRAGVIHISALIPTTRQEHAERHGRAYTPEDQQQWWNTGSNRINCHCTTRSVLIDAEGKVVQAELQRDLKEERKFFS